MNDEIKLSTQTSFMEKDTVQCKKSTLMKFTSLWAAKTFPQKVLVSKPLKNNDALIHSLLLVLPSP